MDVSASIPAMAPPPGVVPNFISPENHASAFIVVSTVCMALLLPCVALRLYTRCWIARSFGLDDAACILAVGGTLAYTGVILSSLNILGRHQWDVPLIDLTTRFLQELVLANEMVYGPAIFFAKASLFLLYLRVFSPDQATRYWIYFGLITTFAFYLGTTVAFGALCIPRRGESWPEGLFSKHCGKSISMTYIQGIFNVISDFYILILPIPVVVKLQLPLRKKVGVCAIFMTGLLASTASAVGLYYRILLARHGDFTWLEVPVGSLVIIELSMGIICGCMPFLAGYFRRLHLKSIQIPLLKSFTHRISSAFSRRFGHSKESSAFNRVDSHAKNEHYLETKILGSVQGKGKFLDSGNRTQRVWLERTAVTRDSRMDTPIPEGWSV